MVDNYCTLAQLRSITSTANRNLQLAVILPALNVFVVASGAEHDPGDVIRPSEIIYSN